MCTSYSVWLASICLTRQHRHQPCSLACRPTCRNRHYVPKLQVLHWEVDNGWVLLHKEVVLGEALDVEHHVGGQLGQAEPPPPSFNVVAGVLPVKLLQQVKDGHL